MTSCRTEGGGEYLMDGLVEEETSARSWSRKAARPCRWLHGKRKQRRDLRLPRARSRRARKRRRRQLRALGTGCEIATTGTGNRKSFGLPDGRRFPGCGWRGLAGRTISVAGNPSRARDRAAHRPLSEKNRDTQWTTRAEISAVEEGF
jgi:hypothetical protein